MLPVLAEVRQVLHDYLCYIDRVLGFGTLP